LLHSVKSQVKTVRFQSYVSVTTSTKSNSHNYMHALTILNQF